MPLPVLIPVAEYLSSTYRPDRDFVDGELVERNVGERPHGLLQGILFTIFQANRLSWGLLPLLEQRVQTNETRFRVPDLCVVRPGEKDPIVRRSPLLCVEVLSSDDRLARAQQRALDYLTMGVEHVWIIDPIAHEAWRCDQRREWIAVSGTLTIEGTAVRISLPDVFVELRALLAWEL